ncbi:MAG: ABC transporter substrate-binding protein [Anaerolineae bacterium]|nr:ABC transporter substrate-binding protein [Anaerolineae bacterium]MCB9459661.1 ABC transporter substrate-binding protein [Anaerolineaceae bacterium]
MRKFFHHIPLTLIILSMLLLVIAPVSAQEDTLTVLCTPQEDWCVEMTAAFEAETGIQTNYVRLSSGESLARIRASQEDPEFSVWWGGPADAFIAAKEEGLLDQYESPNAEIIPDQYKDADGYWTGVYVGALGFCSNVDILDELGVDAPTSWADLLAPELEGFVAMAHPATSGTAFTTFWTNVTLAADALEAEEEGTGYDEDGAPTQAAVDAAFEYFAQLNNNILQYTRSGSAPGTLAGQGEIAVAIIFSHDCVKLQEEGFEGILTTTFPEEGTGYEIGGMGIIANGPEPEAARMWYDWTLTAAAQEIGATVNSLQLPTNPDAAISDLAVNLSEINVVDYNFAAAGASRNEIVERFDAEIATAPTE